MVKGSRCVPGEGVEIENGKRVSVCSRWRGGNKEW